MDYFKNKLKLNKSGESKMIGELDLIALLIQIVVGIVVTAPVLWLVGRSLVGREKAKFLDAVWIVALGTVIGEAVVV